MYCGHARLCVCLCVCLSAAACPYYCTDTDVTWESGTGCPLVVHYGAELQSVHGLRCYGNITRTRNVSEYMLVLALCLVCLLLLLMTTVIGIISHHEAAHKQLYKRQIVACPIHNDRRPLLHISCCHIVRSAYAAVNYRRPGLSSRCSPCLELSAAARHVCTVSFHLPKPAEDSPLQPLLSSCQAREVIPSLRPLLLLLHLCGMTDGIYAFFTQLSQASRLK